MRSINIDTAELNLQQFWGFDGLRPKQLEALQSLSDHKRILTLLPTGGGKSLCYQLAALQLDGIAIVISPLIALIEDQVSSLNKIGLKAAAVHSGHSNYDIDRILSNIKYDGTKLLYVSPERLQTEAFKLRMLSYSIDLIAVDEAHCIAQWGHDFRPAYKQIHSFIDMVMPSYVIGLTGTANQRTTKEICDELDITSNHIVKDSFLRDNIFLRIRNSEDKLQDLLELIGGNTSKVVIYTRSRRNVEMIASFLKNHGVPAAYYHAGLAFKVKKGIQSDFLKNKVRVVAATNAFGMGIDIPDITSVIHYDIPPSIEEYYQEIGRAGRNGAPSKAMLLYSNADLSYQKNRLEKEFPPIASLYQTYRKIHQYYSHDLNEGEGRKYTFNLSQFAEYLKKGSRIVNKELDALRKLGCLSIIINPIDQWHIKYTMDFRAVREYKVSKALADLKEALIRNYAHLKDDWFKVDMNHLSKLITSDIGATQRGIRALGKHGILKWHHLPAGPTIIFTEGRLNKKDFGYKSGRYDLLKEIKKTRLESMLAYVATQGCYNKSLLAYFDEETTAYCGICQNCEDKVKDSISNEALIPLNADDLAEVILAAIKNKNYELLRRIQHLSSEGMIDQHILTDITDEVF